jgi:hypothetical protein
MFCCHDLFSLKVVKTVVDESPVVSRRDAKLLCASAMQEHPDWHKHPEGHKHLLARIAAESRSYCSSGAGCAATPRNASKAVP